MDTIGRYRILGELGRGAMGIVYRALDTTIGREVAIKTIRLTDLADPVEQQRLRDRLFREAQSAGILSHPNIVTIYDISEERDIAYIAMELVDGPTLDRMVESDPPGGKQVLSILSQTAAALDYAHKRGIVHRDIKPANIMIHERETAKITDFGVARLESHQMTQAGSMVGTPNYMSPEQIQGHQVDGRSDQFSLGVITYELMAGEKPFSADSIAALAYRIVREEPTPVHRLNSTLDWPVDTVVQRALAKNPADRYPTCSDFVFALENACRACRTWQPLARGAAQDLATVTAPAPKPVRTAPPRVVEKKEEPEVAAAPVPARPRPPMFVRAARWFALVVLGGALMAALLVGGLRYLEQRQEMAATPQSTPPTQEQAAPTPDQPQARKPSAMPSPETAGAQPEKQPQEQEQAKQEEPAPTPPTTHAPPPAPAKAGTGTTRLITNPPGALLVVDGLSTLSCMSPCSLPLSKGRHTLAATMAGYRRTLRILETPKDDEIFMNLDRASGSVMVRSEPRGATILVNGQSRSERTPALLILPVGTYQIEVVYGGDHETHEVQVKDSAITNLAINFPGQQ